MFPSHVLPDRGNSFTTSANSFSKFSMASFALDSRPTKLILRSKEASILRLIIQISEGLILSPLFLLFTQGIHYFNGPPLSYTTACKENESYVYSLTPDNSLAIFQSEQISPIFSPNCEYFCVHHQSKSKLSIIRSVGFEKCCELSCPDVQLIEWSPAGKYIITWSRTSKVNPTGTPEGNLRIWSAMDGTLLTSYHQRQQVKEVIQWNLDDSFCFKMVSGEIQLLNPTGFAAEGGGSVIFAEL